MTLYASPVVDGAAHCCCNIVLIWVVVNVISVALFAHKELWLTCVLYALFTAMSMWGWRAWQRKLRTHMA